MGLTISSVHRGGWVEEGGRGRLVVAVGRPLDGREEAVARRLGGALRRRAGRKIRMRGFMRIRVAIQLAKIWLEFWLEKRLEIPF